MKRQRLLRRSRDLQRVRVQGHTWEHPLLVLCAIPNQLAYSRFGFVASKRVGTAVARNRARRLMREVIRLKEGAIQAGWDLVLIARRGAAESYYQEMEWAIGQLCQRANLLQPEDEPASESRE